MHMIDGFEEGKKGMFHLVNCDGDVRSKQATPCVIVKSEVTGELFLLHKNPECDGSRPGSTDWAKWSKLYGMTHSWIWSRASYARLLHWGWDPSVENGESMLLVL